MKLQYFLPFMLIGSLVYTPSALADDLLVPDRIKRRMNRALLVPDTLQNSGFEASDVAGKLSSWTRVVHSGDSYHVDFDDRLALGGKRSLMIKNTGKPSWGGAQQLIRAEQMAGREVELTAQARGEGVSAPGFYVALKILRAGGEWDFIKMKETVQGDADWKKVGLRTLLPKETTHLEVNLILEGDGRVWVDDVHLGLLPEKGKPSHE